MKRIENLVNMDEMDAALDIIDFLIDNKFYYKECEWDENARVRAIHALAKFLVEDVSSSS